MRINTSDLEILVKRLNNITNSPEAYMTDGKCNIGHYCLSWAYGGVQLQRVCTDGGGITNVLGGGYCTKRELFEKMHAFISGIEYNQSQENPK